jgi:hypothetical protein
MLIHEVMAFVGRQSKSTWKDSRELHTSTVNQAFMGDFCGVKTLASWIVAVKSYSFYYYEYITSNYDHFSEILSYNPFRNPQIISLMGFVLSFKPVLEVSVYQHLPLQRSIPVLCL